MGKEFDIKVYLKALYAKRSAVERKVSRLKSGIPGLDKALSGGFLSGSMITVSGGVASGKTLFVLTSFLSMRFSKKEKGLLVSFSEDKKTLESLTRKFELDLPDNVEILVFDKVTAEKSEVFQALAEKVSRGDIGYVMINSISDLFLAGDGFIPAICSLMKHYGCTAFLCYPVDKNYCSPAASIPKDEVFESSDTVIFLNYEQLGAGRKRSLSVVKMKNSEFDEGVHLLEISDKGVMLPSGAERPVPEEIVLNAAVSFHDIHIDRKVVEEFKKLNPSMLVRLSGIEPAAYQTFTDKVSADIRSGEFDKDLFICKVQDTRRLMEEGLLLPLGAYFGYDTEKRFRPEIMKVLFRDTNLFGVPYSVMAMGLVYRKDLYKKHGIKPPVLMGELLETTEFIRKKEGIERGFVYEFDGRENITTFMLTLALNSTAFEGEPTERLRSVSGGHYEKAIEFIKKCRNPKGKLSEIQTVELVENGEAVVGFTTMFGFSAGHMARDKSLVEKIGYLAFPKGENSARQYVLCMAHAMAIPNTTRIPTYAAEFAEFMTGEGLINLARSMGKYPTLHGNFEADRAFAGIHPAFSDVEKVTQNLLLKDVEFYNPIVEGLLCDLLNSAVKGEDTGKIVSVAAEKYDNWKKANFYEDTVIKAVRYMEDNFGEKLTLDKIASSANLSVNHFEKIFKAKRGKTVHDYLTDIRIQKAKKLLKEKYDRNISEIANLTGFFDSHHFARIFRLRTGKTPSEFRL